MFWLRNKKIFFSNTLLSGACALRKTDTKKKILLGYRVVNFFHSEVGCHAMSDLMSIIGI